MVPLTIVRAMGLAMSEYGEGPDATSQSVASLENG